MNQSWTRRNFVRLAVALPAAASFSHFRALAQPNLKKIKITSVKAMAIRNIAGNCLIRIDTDAGLTGYGEAGSTGPMARARIDTMKLPVRVHVIPVEEERILVEAALAMRYA